MKLIDLFKKGRNKPAEQEPESVQPNQDEDQIFKKSESYTNILERIDSDEASELQTRELEGIGTEDVSVQNEAEDSPDDLKTEEVAVEFSVDEDEAVPEEVEQETPASRPDSEAGEIDYFSEFREVPQDIETAPEAADSDDEEIQSTENTILELKEEEREYLAESEAQETEEVEDAKAETPQETEEVEDAKAETPQETEKPEAKTDTIPEEDKETPEKKRRKISVSNIFKRRRKVKEEPQLTAPLDTIMDRAQDELGMKKPSRKKHSEYLLSNALKEDEVPLEQPEATIEFKRSEITSPKLEVGLEEAPTIEFEIGKQIEEDHATDLLDELNASPVLEENLRKGIEEERGISLPDSTANMRRKDMQRQLRRQEKASRERESSQAMEMTRNLDQIVEKQQSLIYANVPDNILKGGILLFSNLARQMDSTGALRVESLMSILGSLAGYSIQAGIREKMVNRLKLSEDQVFSIVETKDGQRYFFGDPIDRALQKDKSSLWYMVASATQRLTGHVDSNVDETVRYTTRNIGKDTFGIPRLPKNHRPNHTPQYYVEHMWEALVPGLERFTDDPLQWPLVFAVALQRALICTKNILDPNISLKIILESAIPMTVADVKPIRPSEVEVKEFEEESPEALREQIRIIRANLESSVSVEQRQNLLEELSVKTEQLYEALSPRSEVTLQIEQELN